MNGRIQSNGAPRRNRTGTPIQEQDFESCASTNSARGAQIFKFELGMLGEYSIAAGQVNQEDGQNPFFDQA